MIDLLLEDGPLLAVNKPAGLPTQAPAAFPSLEADVKAYLKAKHQKAGNVYLGIPHRLDRPVSGVVVFARNSKCAARLAEQFQQREVRKIYWAILEHPPDEPSGMLQDWLRKLPGEARGEVVPAHHPDGREARLRYRVLGTAPSRDGGPGGTLVEIELETGRMHQIRIQFASRGWPILGDELYGGAPLLGVPPSVPNETTDFGSENQTRDARILLHARSLELKHPIRYDTVRIVAPVPADWPAALPDDTASSM